MAYYKIFSCEVLFREVCFEAAQSSNTIDLTFNRFALHQVGSDKMVAELQQLVDSVPPREYDAILMAYGLCNNGVVGLTARSVPLVIPRAHDCITLLLGSKDRYGTEFEAEPGTYYYSPGWIEHHHSEEEEHQLRELGLRMSYKELVEKYGEENAKYLQETMGDMQSYEEHYTRLAYIDTGLGPRDELIRKSQTDADNNGWRFELLEGNRSIIRQLLQGDWPQAEFLVVEPGQSIRATHDASVIAADPQES